MPNPFLPDEDDDRGAVVAALPAEFLLVGGAREHTQMVCLSPTAEIDPLRDALVLDAVLSSALPEETMINLVVHLVHRWGDRTKDYYGSRRKAEDKPAQPRRKRAEPE